MPSANSQISMCSQADRWSVSIGVPLYLHTYFSSVSKLNYHADWYLSSQTDWSENSLNAQLVAMIPNDAPVKRKTLIRLHRCTVWSKSSLFVGFCAPVPFIIVSILIYKPPSTGQKFPNIWFERTKAGLKCPEIGHEMSETWVQVDFGRNVQGPKCPLLWCGFRRFLLVTQSTTTRSKSILAATWSQILVRSFGCDF